ncbi:hypothetical protein E2C01_085438 [Portunus trituberculatus]|uniref:Uncharacterized protein n=1 Tax=Portunus trituberculatus TaxID=210409 RepID=A0A5B7IXU8_PORTR|nr:hypothetical protein [Portunus trituberculatus]
MASLTPNETRLLMRDVGRDELLPPRLGTLGSVAAMTLPRADKRHSRRYRGVMRYFMVCLSRDLSFLPTLYHRCVSR